MSNMTQEEIEGNKILVEYMNILKVRDCTPTMWFSDDLPTTYIMATSNFGGLSTTLLKFKVEQLKYHESMDWLYPVYQKIKLFVSSKEYNDLDNYSKMLLKTHFNIMKTIIAEGESIEVLFKSVVEWVKIYNLKVLEDDKT
jgi:hypothetical protein